VARIRSTKPEFWSHPVIGRLDDYVKTMALALLNLADDEGYFLADPILVRNFARPFDEDSTITRRALEALSIAEWIALSEHPSHGPIGLILNFRKHQKIDRPTPSKISIYFDSSIPRRALDEPSSLEGKGREGKGTTTSSPCGDAASAPSPRSKAPRGRSFGLVMSSMPEEVRGEFLRAWEGYPTEAWNFETKTMAPRRRNQEGTAKRYMEILEHNRIRTPWGDRLTAKDLTDLTLFFVAARKRHAIAKSEHLNVPGIENFFSSIDGPKSNPWQNAANAWLASLASVKVGVGAPPPSPAAPAPQSGPSRPAHAPEASHV